MIVSLHKNVYLQVSFSVQSLYFYYHYFHTKATVSVSSDNPKETSTWLQIKSHFYEEKGEWEEVTE